MLGYTGTGVSSDADTKVTCTFPKGVPATDTGVSPTVMFNTTAGSLSKTALTGGQTINNPMGTPSGQSTSCSFEGGCLYSILGTGLAAAMAGDEANNKVTVCGSDCVLDIDNSDSSTARCKLPPVLTSFSAATFDMREAAVLTGNWGGTASSTEIAKLSDGNNLIDYTDTAVPCYFEIAAEPGKVFQVEEAKVFINNLLDNTPYVAYFKMQGSDESR